MSADLEAPSRKDALRLLSARGLQVAAVNESIDALRDYWLAQADLDMARIGPPELGVVSAPGPGPAAPHPAGSGPPWPGAGRSAGAGARRSPAGSSACRWARSPSWSSTVRISTGPPCATMACGTIVENCAA